MFGFEIELIYLLTISFPSLSRAVTKKHQQLKKYPSPKFHCFSSLTIKTSRRHSNSPLPSQPKSPDIIASSGQTVSKALTASLTLFPKSILAPGFCVMLSVIPVVSSTNMCSIMVRLQTSLNTAVAPGWPLPLAGVSFLS